jgi:putative tricarboxylic transport membrane protein
MMASSADNLGKNQERAGNMGTYLRRALFAAALGLLAAPSAYAVDWPTRPITIVVPFEQGGSVDRLARGIAPYMQKELGQPVTVTNQPGAAGQVASTWLLHQPDDGYSIMMTPAIPYLAVNILATHASYKISDFAFLNAQWTDFQLIAVPNDRPYKTLSQLIDAIKANPGKISVGLDFGSQGHFATLSLLDALKLPTSALRIVTFDGGGPLRTALIGGQIDFSIVQGEGSEPIKSLIRSLAVYLDHPSAEFSGPPINEALKPYGITVPLLSGSIRTFATSAAFRTKHPDEFNKLVDGYHKALETPAFQAWLKTNSIGGDWVGPKKTTEIINANFKVLEKYAGLLKK